MISVGWGGGFGFSARAWTSLMTYFDESFSNCLGKTSKNS